MYALFERTRPLRHLSWLTRYGATTLLVGVAFAIRYAFSDVLRDFPFLLFFPPLILSCVLFNQGSGVVATVLSAVLVAFFFLEPIGHFAIRDPGQFLGWCLFVVIGIAITIIIEAQHAAYRQLDRAHVALQQAHAAVVASEAEKADLLREMNHRTMNNLHTVVSLLHLQARSTSDQAREDLLTTAERVNVMAKVQQRLVRSDGADTADVKEFIEGLCNDLRAALIGARPVQLIVRAESLPIPLNKAISVGLIVNELVVNSLKYAFPDKREGGVVVEFARKGGEYHLRVSDDGIGSGPQSNAAAPPQGSARLGQRLIRSFVAQLAGRIEIENRSPGTTVVVWFPASEQEGIREGTPPA